MTKIGLGLSGRAFLGRPRGALEGSGGQGEVAMGGAIASHLRIGDPMLSHVLFGVYLGLFAWGGLWLRDPKLRAVTPWRR